MACNVMMPVSSGGALPAARSSACPPAMPPIPAARARPATSSRLRRCGKRLSPRRGFEGERQQAVAREDGGRLVEGPVHRRLAAPEIVIVHRRQIVMDQRIAVHAFERRGDPQRIAGSASNSAALSITSKGRSRLPPLSTPCRIAASRRCGRTISPGPARAVSSRSSRPRPRPRARRARFRIRRHRLTSPRPLRQSLSGQATTPWPSRSLHNRPRHLLPTRGGESDAWAAMPSK